MGILQQLAKSSKKRWFHASPEAFKTLDAEKLGTGEGGADSLLGFHFSAKPSTAEGYLEDFSSINPETFKNVHGMTIDEAQKKADSLLKKYAAEENITVKDALDYGKNPKAIQGVRARSDTAKEYKQLNKILNPYTYESGYGGINSSKWLNKNKSGYVMSAEIPDESHMKIVDMGGDAYDEARHTAIGKEAKAEGYKGVIFKNVVDDALSGSGVDDIALVFDTSDVNVVKATPRGNAEPVDFSSLKSMSPLTTGLTTLGGGTLGSMLFGSNDAEASPISFVAKSMKKIDDEIAKYEEIAEQYRSYLPNAETASPGEILREVNPQYSKYYQELKQMKSTAPLRSETENIRAVNDIIKNKRKDLPSVAIGTGAMGGLSPEEQLFASNQPEMSAMPEGGIREALYSVGDVLKSRERDDITSTQELGDVFNKLGRGEKLGLMDYLESTAVTDPTSYPAILDALKEYLRKNGNN